MFTMILNLQGRLIVVATFRSALCVAQVYLEIARTTAKLSPNILLSIASRVPIS